MQSGFEIELTGDRIDDSRLYELCEASISEQPTIELVHETKRDYAVRIRTMTTINSQPLWLRREPESVLAELMAQGRRAILLYGPPRTGKTRAVDTICPRNDSRRATIQLHEGWGYENLITGLFPVTDSPGEFAWRDGELLKALRKGKKHIVLEEVNRTRVSQALGEVFSLLEVSYRGPEHAIQLPNGESFAIDPDVTLYFTMNNIDRSTEDIDDALLGRVDSVEFPPRVEALAQILESKQIDQTVAAAIRRFFTTLQDLYPLGHGYFASLDKDTDFRLFYSTRIRPVLVNHFASFDPSIVAQVDNEVDELFD